MSDAKADAVRLARADGTLAAYLQGALIGVVGEPLSYLGRVTDMIEIGLGPRIAVPTAKAPARMVSTHIFHVQCPIRLDGPDGVIVGAYDVYVDRTGSDRDEDFDWHPIGSNLFDARVEQFIATHPLGSLVCERVHTDSAAGVRLQLSSGFVVTIFPHGTAAVEYWRYFRFDEPEANVVVYEE